MSETKLVSVESQTEQSLTSGKAETRIFVKMYVDAVRTGLIADMGARNWTTLCVIASYMDAKGDCYPTQSQIANGLGVSRQTANKYINDLLAYRWQGQAVVVGEQARDNGQFSTLLYRLNTDVIVPADNNIYAITDYKLPHGISDLSEEERIKRRAIPGYRKWVDSVKESANYKCLTCGDTENLVAHHLDNFADFPEKRTSVSNGVCLCAECHLDFHSKYGMKRASRADFDDYLMKGC